GTSRILVEIVDSSSPGRRVLRQIDIVVNGPMQLTSALPSALKNAPYSAQLIATGGLSGRTWSVLAGQPPPGINVGVDGLVSGTPTSGGSFTFTARVVDSSGNSVQGDVSIAVNTPWTTTFPTGGIVNP